MHGRRRNSLLRLLIVFASLWTSAVFAQQYPRIGYVFPAGGRQGTTFWSRSAGSFGLLEGRLPDRRPSGALLRGGIQATVRKTSGT